jgi:hypothetical protein
MFWTLNDALGKVLLVVVLGAVAVCVLSPFWEFGTTWRQCQEDVEEYQRQCEERPPVGFLNGKTYYSREELAADTEELWREHEEKYGQPYVEMLEDARDRTPDLGFDH